MPSFALRYTRFRLAPTAPFPEGQTVARPLVAMRLMTLGRQMGVDCTACLDTGADHCVFPLSFADQLGLDPAQMPRAQTGGVTGRGDVFYSDARIFIPLENHMFAVAARVGFMAGLDALGMGLLGQTGFFDSCTVVFDQARDTFTINVSQARARTTRRTGT